MGFAVPIGVIVLISRKTDALVAIALGTIGGLIMSLLFQGELMTILGNGEFQAMKLPFAASMVRLLFQVKMQFFPIF